MVKNIKQPKITSPNASKIEILKQGMQTEFWKIITEAMEESKEFIMEQQDGEDIQGLDAELYKATNELFKAKKKLIDKLIETPKNMIKWFEKPVSEIKNFDPYDD